MIGSQIYNIEYAWINIVNWAFQKIIVYQTKLCVTKWANTIQFKELETNNTKGPENHEASPLKTKVKNVKEKQTITITVLEQLKPQSR